MVKLLDFAGTMIRFEELVKTCFPLIAQGYILEQGEIMRLILIPIFLAIISHISFAEEDIVVVSPGKKSNASASESFSDKVKTIRVSDGEWDIFFEKKGGPFTIPGERDNTGALQQVCKAAYDKKIVIKVSVDSANDILISAEVDQWAQTQNQDTSKKKDSAEQPAYNIDAELEKAMKGIKGR